MITESVLAHYYYRPLKYNNQKVPLKIILNNFKHRRPQVLNVCVISIVPSYNNDCYNFYFTNNKHKECILVQKQAIKKIFAISDGSSNNNTTNWEKY